MLDPPISLYSWQSVHEVAYNNYASRLKIVPEYRPTLDV